MKLSKITAKHMQHRNT